MVQLPGNCCGLLPCRMFRSSSQDGHDLTDVNLLWWWNKAKMIMASLWHTPCFSKIHHNRICSWIPGQGFTCELKLMNIISKLNPILYCIPKFPIKKSNHLKSPPGAHQHLLKATPTAIPSAAEWQNLPGKRAMSWCFVKVSGGFNPSPKSYIVNLGQSFQTGWTKKTVWNNQSGL